MKVGLLGDLFLSGQYGDWPQEDCATVLSGLRGLLAGNDINIANFEGVVFDEPEPPPGQDKILLPVQAAFVGAMALAGIDVVSLSNNHVLDWGARGLQETTKHLSAAGVGSFGAGQSIDEAAQLELRDVAGLRLGLLGFTCESTHPGAWAGAGPGVARLQDDDVESRVASAKARCDVLLVSVHWGDEHVAWPSPQQLSMARRLVDAGADLVAGHHAHVFQGCEPYRRGLIAYGLGNATISALSQRVRWNGVEQDYRFVPDSAHRRGVAISVDIEPGRMLRHRLHAFFIGEDGRPVAQVAPLRLLAYRLKRAIWHLPGYVHGYRALVLFQFRVVPKVRAAARWQTWRRALGRLTRRDRAA